MLCSTSLSCLHSSYSVTPPSRAAELQFPRTVIASIRTGESDVVFFPSSILLFIPSSILHNGSISRSLQFAPPAPSSRMPATSRCFISALSATPIPGLALYSRCTACQHLIVTTAFGTKANASPYVTCPACRGIQTPTTHDQAPHSQPSQAPLVSTLFQLRNLDSALLWPRSPESISDATLC